MHAPDLHPGQADATADPAGSAPPPKAPRRTDPKVSVIIRTYNRAGLLAHAVDSVLAQTFADFEIIVVDDHSTDDTPRVTAAFSDPRIRVIRHESNQRAVATGNTGLAQVRGRYVAFLDDDDIWLPTKLERQVSALDAAAPDVAWVYAWRDLVDATGSRVLRSIRKTLEGDIVDSILAMNCPGPPSTWLLRASVLRELGGFRIPPRTRSPVSADVDLMRQLCLRGYRVAVVREVLVRKRIHAGQMTEESMADLNLRAAFYRAHLDEFAEELSSRPRARVKVLFRLAGVEFRLRDFRAVARRGISAFRLAPLITLGLAVGKPEYLYRMVRWLLRAPPP